MNFTSLYQSNSEAVQQALRTAWCNEPRDELQFRYAESVGKLINEHLFSDECAMPVIQCMNPYKSVHSVTSDEAKALVGTLWQNEYPPYEHQYQAWKVLRQGYTEDGLPMSMVVTTGTGSGKTESFMMPLVQDLKEQGKSGAVQAIFLYPLNALMEDQRTRLESLLEGTNLNYAVYNGNLPENYPKGYDKYGSLPDDDQDKKNILASLKEDELRDWKAIDAIFGRQSDGTVTHTHCIATRKDMRDKPPNILLTNLTMLEYMLFRRTDTQLFNGKALRWISIDETHTYSGAGAAELAMLLRRVLLAFGVSAEKIRFATSSATFGNAETEEEKKKAEEDLRKFISDLAGISISQVALIDGEREGEATLDRLTEEDQRLARTIFKKDFLSLDDPDLFPKIHGKIAKLQALEDFAARIDEAKARVQIKVHYFYRVPNNGLFVRLDECNDGLFKIEHKNLIGNRETESENPLVELGRCRCCGSYLVPIMWNPDTGEYRPLEGDDTDIFDLPDESSDGGKSERYAILSPAKGEPTSNNIACKIIDHKIAPCPTEELSAWHFSRNEHKRCPHCGTGLVKDRSNKFPTEGEDDLLLEDMRIQKFRFSQNLTAQVLAPSILNETKGFPSSDDSVMNDGRQFLSFVDSRQGAARSSMGQNLEEEEKWIYQTIFHDLNARGGCDNKAQIAELREQRDNAEDNDDNELVNRLSEEIKCLRAQSRPYLTWENAAELLKKTPQAKRYAEVFTQKRELNRDGTMADGFLEKYLHSAMARILAKYPTRAPSPENLGLFRTYYPKLERLTALPPSVIRFNEGLTNTENKIDIQDWRDFLSLFLDYSVRRGSEAFYFKLPNEKKIDYNDLNRFSTERPHRRPISKPTPKGTSRFARWLKELYARDTSGSEPETELLAEVFNDLWNDLVRINLIQPSEHLHHLQNERVWQNDPQGDNGSIPYRLNLIDIAFMPFTQAAMCEITSPGCKSNSFRPIPYSFKGLSPYPGVLPSFETWSKVPASFQSKEDFDSWAKKNRKGLHDKNLLGDYGTFSDFLPDIYLKRSLFIESEHTAQIEKHKARRLQDDFKRHRINILSCSTTMEMGVDLGNRLSLIRSPYAGKLQTTRRT